MVQLEKIKHKDGIDEMVYYEKYVEDRFIL